MGFTLGPALATPAWSISSYEAEGMRAAMATATAFSACSVAVLEPNRVSRQQASDGRRPAVPHTTSASAAGPWPPTEGLTWM